VTNSGERSAFTSTTQARRASPQAKELVEQITHNAAGEMVDNYTHWEWDPLCSVVSAYPSLLPNSETAHGNAPTSGNSGENMNPHIVRSASYSPPLSVVLEKLSVRVLESEQKNKSLRGHVSESVSEYGAALKEVNEARQSRLEALHAIGEASAVPGLAACRALGAAYEGDQAGVESALVDMAAAIAGGR